MPFEIPKGSMPDSDRLTQIEEMMKVPVWSKIKKDKESGKTYEEGSEIDKSIEESPISSKKLGQLLDLVNDGTVSNKIAKEVFEDMFKSSKEAKEIIEEKGLKQISNEDDIEKLVDKIIIENETQVKQFKEGNTKVMGWFVGQIMKLTKGQANPGIVNKIILKKLNN